MSERILDEIFGGLLFQPLTGQQARASGLRGRMKGLIVPGNVPDPLVVEALRNFLQGSATFVKLSRRMRRFGDAYLRFLERSSESFRGMFKWTASLERFFKEAERLGSVTVYGSDETVDKILLRLPEGTSFIGHGHKFSAGIVFTEAMRRIGVEKLALRCAYDTWMYDQRGCLSPQAYFVESPDDYSGKTGTLREIGQRLQNILLEWERRYGPVRRPYEEKRRRRVFLDRLLSESLDPEGLEFMAPADGTRPVVYILKKCSFMPGSGCQVIGLKSFRELADIRRELEPFQQALTCLSVAGSRRDTREVREFFRSWSLERICRVGEMQTPYSRSRDLALSARSLS